MNESQLHNESVEFMRRHCPQSPGIHQARLVSSCALFLKSVADISDAKARTISVKALGEYESRLHDATVDIDASTSHTLFVKCRREGVTYAVTTATLMKLLRGHAVTVT